MFRFIKTLRKLNKLEERIAKLEKEATLMTYSYPFDRESVTVKEVVEQLLSHFHLYPRVEKERREVVLKGGDTVHIRKPTKYGIIEKPCAEEEPKLEDGI
jgi:hypothetical protein